VGLMLLTITTFLAVTGLVLATYYALTAESAVERRLRTLVPGAAVATMPAETTSAEPGAVERMLVRVGRQGAVGGAERSVAQTLSMAGFRGPNAAFIFLGIRTLLSFGPALFILVPRVSQGEPLGHSLLLAAGFGVTGHVLANMWLRLRAQARGRKITDALPDTLDLMVTCLEAGLGLNATIARIGEERSSLNDPLGREFSQVSVELRSGRSREEALRALGNRNGVDDLKALSALIVQSDRLGASMAKTLRAHADLVRTKRRQRAEEAARKLPIKMLFPLALFILPALFIVVGGPAILRIGDLVNLLSHQ
jgi:tight adherence protein C